MSVEPGDSEKHPIEALRGGACSEDADEPPGEQVGRRT